MIAYQRDILLVNLRMPQGGFKAHPVLVISNNNTNEYEEQFLAVMLSGSKNYEDEYSFWLKNNMLSKELTKETQIRANIIQSFSFDEIIRKMTIVKKEYFNKIYEHITKNVC